MIARAIDAKVPFCFVAADTVYGMGMIETQLRDAGKGYVLGAPSNRVFHSWGKPQPVSGTADTIAQSLPKSVWRRLSSGEGTKGPRLHDWAYVELADLDASEYNNDLVGEWTRGLLIRRNITDGDLAFCVPRAQQWQSWWRWKGIAGRSRIVLRLPRMSLASITR